jgi:hypothetical protein
VEPTEEAVNEELRYRLGLKSYRLADPTSFSDGTGRQIESYQRYAEDMLRTIPPRDRVSLRFAVFDTDQINGIAMKGNIEDQEIRFATISTGAIRYFHTFFPYLMSRTDVLPSIGIVTREQNLPYKLIPSRSYPALQYLTERGLRKRIEPIDPQRKEFAQIMTLTATQFLIWHEIVHCVNGHVAQDVFHLDEVDKPATLPPKTTLLHHTFEMDADACAVNQLFHATVRPHESEEQFRWNAQLGDFPPNKRLYPSLVALFLVFRIMARPETLSMNADGLLTGSHPHPAVRAHLCRVTLATLSLSRGPEGIGDWLSKLIAKSAIDASYIWATLTQTQEPRRLLTLDDESLDAGMDRMTTHMNVLLDYWHELRPHLLPFAMVSIPPSKYEGTK